MAVVRTGPRRRSVALLCILLGFALTACSSWVPSATPLRVPSKQTLEKEAAAYSICGNLAAAKRLHDAASRRNVGVGLPQDWVTNYEAWSAEFAAEAVYIRGAARKTSVPSTAAAIDQLAEAKERASQAATTLAAMIRHATDATSRTVLDIQGGPAGTAYSRALGDITQTSRHVAALVSNDCKARS